MKRYRSQYRNQQWLFTVYRAVDGDDYILEAVVPWIGWYNIAMRLNTQEVETLRCNENDFTEIVDRFVRGKDLPEFKTRRIENHIKSLDVDEIGLIDDPPDPLQ